ncbi:MAG: cyclic nucleotide-binding domain-containing protein [Magnetococcales bacterium]|nr:cyclic nucleotide-binding domain-containing protein [Magnetococcales bacterium]
MPTVVGYSQEQIIDLMKAIPFFDTFTLYEKKRMASFYGGFVTYGPGTRIITEGKKDTSFYILLTGKVATEKQGVEINSMGKGEIFGEMAFFANTERSTSVVAQESVFLFRVNQESLQRLGCEIREKIKDQCMIKMIKRIEKLTERLRVRM